MKNNYRKYGDTKIISPKVIRVPVQNIKVDPKDYHEIILNVSELIEDAGYNPVSQILGYILSEDPTHITNYRGARNMMSGIDRDDLLEEIIKYYLEEKNKNGQI